MYFLTGNKITNEGAQKIYCLIENTSSLTEIFLYGNQVSESIQNQLDDICQRNMYNSRVRSLSLQQRCWHIIRKYNIPKTFITPQMKRKYNHPSNDWIRTFPFYLSHQPPLGFVNLHLIPVTRFSRSCYFCNEPIRLESLPLAISHNCRYCDKLFCDNDCHQAQAHLPRENQ